MNKVTIVLMMVFSLLLAACGSAEVTDPTAEATPDVTAQVAVIGGVDAPIPATARTRYEGLIQLTSDEGYPQLGSPNAAAQMRLYAGFDSIASRDLFNNALVALLADVRTGDLRVTFVPLYEGSLENVAAATRSALCAGEQGAFWAFHETLYSWNEAFGPNAFTAERLDAAVNALVPDRAAWDACIGSERPDQVLAAARSETFTLEGFTSPPGVFINGSPVAPDLMSIVGEVDAAKQAAQQAANVPPTSTGAAEITGEASTVPTVESTQPAVITWTPSPGPSQTSLPTTTPIEFNPDEQVPPPIAIGLPEGWQVGYGIVPLSRQIPFALYNGPVSGGIGTIIVLWGFVSVVPPLDANPLDPDSLLGTDIYSEGILLFRQAIIEPDCQRVGTDVVREYSVGGQLAFGTEIAILDCPTTPDARGWFAGLQVDGINFVFYVYTEPLEAMDAARAELQTILDGVVFRVNELLPTDEP